MAKQTVLLFVILAASLTFPNAVLSSRVIQTTQRIVVIDPGHGGPSKGLTASGGLQEKTLVLKLAGKIAQNLENQYNVLLTRNKDTSIPFKDRIFFANKNKADLFISIHLHQSARPFVFLYYFDPPGDHDPSTLTAENTWKSQPIRHRSESKKVIDSFSIVFSLSQTANSFFSQGVPTILLEGAAMPAVLIEPLSIALLSQHVDSPDKIETILDDYAMLISKSIDLYFRKK